MNEKRYWLTDGTECNVLHDLEERGVVVEYYTAGSNGSMVSVIKFLPYDKVLPFNPLPATLGGINEKIEELQNQVSNLRKSYGAENTCRNCKHLGKPVHHAPGYYDCDRVCDESTNDGEPAFLRGYDGCGLYLSVRADFGCNLFEAKPKNEN